MTASSLPDSLKQIIIDRILSISSPEKIILFGSYARGEATADSDVDLLVVYANLTKKRPMAVAIRRALADLMISKDVIVTTPKEIEDYGDMVGTVLRPALREGQILYERG